LYDVHLTKRYEVSRFARTIEWFRRREVRIENGAGGDNELQKVVADAKTLLGGDLAFSSQMALPNLVCPCQA
jgi:hypothetical protein